MENQLTRNKLEYFRSLLREERARQHKHIESIEEASLNQSMTESVGELSSYDQHTADAGSEMQAREFDFGLRAAAEVTVSRIDEALRRIENGSYGTCVDCGDSIPVERLEAIPFADRCTSCSAERDKRSERIDAAERSLTFERSFTDGADNAGFDGEDTWEDLGEMGTANSPQDDLHFEHDR